MEIVSQTVPSRPAAPPQPNDAAFDAWLQQQLTAVHDRVLQEPVPERLLCILRNPTIG